MLLLLSFVYYLVSTVVMLVFLPTLPLPILALVFYLFPLLLHTYVLQKSRHQKELLFNSLSLASLSFFSYLVFAFLAEKFSLWASFVAQNTIATEEMTVQIADSPLALSQISFVLILYIVISVVNYYVKLQKMKKEKQNAQYSATI